MFHLYALIHFSKFSQGVENLTKLFVNFNLSSQIFNFQQQYICRLMVLNHNFGFALLSGIMFPFRNEMMRATGTTEQRKLMIGQGGSYAKR